MMRVVRVRILSGEDLTGYRYVATLPAHGEEEHVVIAIDRARNRITMGAGPIGGPLRYDDWTGPIDTTRAPRTPKQRERAKQRRAMTKMCSGYAVRLDTGKP